ncbi:uncharacterized protein G2W53_038364 [Senna tora]|uniref:Uncharacterized protein n=1 Tax=Senna tora TaxID=362788 RepID=A0A834SNY9_9FABA|nr:uncharacterized protein G2W53_038364 [Senna tora]
MEHTIGKWKDDTFKNMGVAEPARKPAPPIIICHVVIRRENLGTPDGLFKAEVDKKLGAANERATKNQTLKKKIYEGHKNLWPRMEPLG